MRKLFISFLLVIPVHAIAEQEYTEATMDVLCGKTTVIVSKIQGYQENLIWSSLEDNGTVVSLWRNETKNTFTMIKTAASGQYSCIISAGRGDGFKAV